jgi:hypothetical protein
MAAWAANCNLEPTASKGLADDGIAAAAVNHERMRDALFPFGILEDVPDAAQVAFALFPNIADEDEIGLAANLALSQGACYRQHAHDAGRVVAYSGPDDAITLLSNGKFSPARENCVQMCSDRDSATLSVCSGKNANDISGFIDLDMRESKLNESLTEPDCPFLLFKGWGGNCGHFNLPLQQFIFLQVQPGERVMHGAH